MTKMSEPIVFFGSGPVAAASLSLLHQTFAIEAVITKPRPPHHKGDVPVLEMALKLGLPVLTAQTRAELDSLFSKTHFKARLGVLIDFGIIISQKVIDSFRLGIVNSHFSLLPLLRGADPITFAILEDHKETGVSLMLLVRAMDEGPLLTQVRCKLTKGITTPELTKKLILLSYEALRDNIPRYVDGKIKPYPQTETSATYSRRLTKGDGLINWEKPAQTLEKEVRAFTEWPKSRISFGGLDVIITKAHVVKLGGTPGKTTIHGGLPVVYCGDKALAIDELKPAGKREMHGKAFLAGYKNIFLGR